jgi:hypothetical protein
MKKIILGFSILMMSSLAITSCSKDDDNPTQQPAPESTYVVKNTGSAGVTSVTDTNDTTPLGIAQAVPSVSNQVYPSNIPLLFFFNDKILLSSITPENFIVTENNQKVGGTIAINEASNGFAIFTFTPKKAFATNANIKVTLTTAMKDDAGLGLQSDYVLEYQTSAATTTNFNGNLGFESGNSGVSFIGDGNILTGAQGCVNPFGSNFGAITSGNQLISQGSAIGGASSMMFVGPISATNLTSLSFKFNFLSAEFQEYVGSEFDDSFMAIVVGANGAHSEFITSVNTIGTAGNTQCIGFPGLPDTGDGYAGSTGWLTKTLNFSNLGDQVYVVFIVTDVSDEIYSSVVCVDDITL